MKRFTLALLALLLLSGCGSSSHSSSQNSGPSTGPVIQNWEARRNNTSLLIAFNVADADNDIIGGIGTIQVQNQPALSFSKVIEPLPPGVQGLPGFNVYVVYATRDGSHFPSGIPVAFTFSLTDRAGHASNAISGFFVTEGVRGETPGGPMPPVTLQMGERS